MIDNLDYSEDKTYISPKDLFNQILSKASSIFKNKEVLLNDYIPNEIHFRNKEMTQLTTALSPILLGNNSVNVFIFGFSGTGKTLVTRKVVNDLLEIGKQNNDNISCIIMNCRLDNINTEYRLITNLAKIFGAKLPDTGLSLAKVYDKFFDSLNMNNKKDLKLVLVLDEIDYLILKDPLFLYNLSRIKEKYDKLYLSLVGISNILNLKSRIEPKVISSLNPVEIVFSSYSADEIKGILEERVKLAFNEGVVAEGVVSKIAAISAQEHGDVRRAINLLRLSGELAQRKGESHISLEDVDLAYKESEKNIIEETIHTLAPQSKLVLLAILNIIEKKKSDTIFSGEIYDEYIKLANKFGYRELTFRRVSDLIYELDYNSLIRIQLKSRGRYGRSREVGLGFSKEVVPRLEDIIKNDLNKNL
ncbi:MAG: AAA family ATPase [Candidatus Rehaiarchaeum fermentans]|nr:AAA family ATPase [Candidatus Rehaiarchaeum fermentans]MCW1297193.1 AAA family ATPase [Candidatus Rehaiarchaeum fermentans]MCW1302088.1 AAA family ATPase [Candidatus Rehaiarchaeum fermentans]